MNKQRSTQSTVPFLYALIGCRNTRHLIARIPNAFSIFLRALDNPGDIYLLKVKNRNTRKRCKICSKKMIKTPERRHNRRSIVFIVNFEYISRLVLVFLLLTLNMLLSAGNLQLDLFAFIIYWARKPYL